MMNFLGVVLPTLKLFSIFTFFWRENEEKNDRIEWGRDARKKISLGFINFSFFVSPFLTETHYA